MEKEKKQNIQIILLSIIIVLLIGILVFLLFFNKEDESKPVDNNKTTQNSTTNNNEEKIYKTSDGKFTLKIINEQKAYLNDYSLDITNIKDSKKYVLYEGYFSNAFAQYCEMFLIDKENKSIIEQRGRENITDISRRFNGEGNGITFVECDAGYYFALYLGEPFNQEGTIYTTKWQKLGYIDLDNIKSDSKGIYVYSEYDSNYKLSGTPIKYDVNGNKVND